jgi:hypothetical protein
MTLRTLTLALGAVSVALVLELAAILVLNEGRFVYTLDDPYIHFALAAQLRHGHYGIHPGEYAAPSSSPLWPLLLAPFGDLATLEYLPLVLNALLCLATVVLFSAIARRALNASSGGVHLGALLATLALAGVTNTIGLVYTGMEHSLQLWLAVASVWGAWRALHEGRAPGWLWPALSIAPWVRYESAALCVPLWIVLARHGHARAVVLSALAAFVPLAVFSAFLHSLGLPLLPTSVIAKAGAAATASQPLAALGQNLTLNLTRAHAWILLAWAVPLACGMRARSLSSGQRALCAAALAAVAMHLVAGRLGWFSRYEMYVLAGAACVALLAFGAPASAWLAHRPAALVPMLLALGAVHYPHVGATFLTPLGSNNIFEQQIQMQRFAHEILPVPVAVRDLGCVAFRNPEYTLDLNGLASLDALRVLQDPHKTPDWVDELLRRHAIRLAIVPAGWGARHARARWIFLGTLRLSRYRLTPAADAVSFYALDTEAAELARARLAEFVRGLPARLRLESAPYVARAQRSDASAVLPARSARMR